MYCSKCNNKLKAEDKFCTNCGTPVENIKENTINNSNEKDTEEKYTVQKNYQVMWGMVGLVFIIMFAFWVVGEGFSWKVVIIFLIIYFILVAIGAFSNIIFRCPNCKEDVTLSQNCLKLINDDESKCQCPKCNKELIFNTKKFLVKINDIVESTKIIDEDNNAKKLEELYSLKSKGIITEEEYKKKKQELLSKI